MRNVFGQSGSEFALSQSVMHLYWQPYTLIKTNSPSLSQITGEQKIMKCFVHTVESQCTLPTRLFNNVHSSQ